MVNQNEPGEQKSAVDPDQKPATFKSNTWGEEMVSENVMKRWGIPINIDCAQIKPPWCHSGVVWIKSSLFKVVLNFVFKKCLKP